MNLAVMQPYLFPYIGYFQLIYASDIFVIYDDVSFIKQGYINRNTLLSNGKPVRFTVPVPGASSNRKISSLNFSNDIKKVIRTIHQSYSKKPYFRDVFPLVEDVLLSADRSISSVCLKSYINIFNYLDIKKEMIKSSDIDYDRYAGPSDKLIEFCKKFNANRYINSIGGMELYSKDEFLKNDIDLCFLKPVFKEYNQGGIEFIPGLSIIDCLMHCPPDKVKSFLCSYELV